LHILNSIGKASSSGRLVTLAGIRPSRVWTLGVLWTGRGVQILDASVTLDGTGAMAGIRASRVWTLLSFGKHHANYFYIKSNWNIPLN